ncbi:hypothetical protein OPV22_002030 [Ensete ventricosum]|uniref:Uncharacterized protein n=1 Tax=Ensete ventricosum TaxID=4639 RepID=A0AAV8RWT5_ENSVE|nr:hypothetical protein OPV22_002030 [Ensete ventricosum]
MVIIFLHHECWTFQEFNWIGVEDCRSLQRNEDGTMNNTAFVSRNEDGTRNRQRCTKPQPLSFHGLNMRLSHTCQSAGCLTSQMVDR